MTKAEKDLFKNSVSLESVCKNEIYKSAALKFNTALSKIEKLLPEDEQALVLEIIHNRAVLETIVGDYMFRKGLRLKFRTKH